MPLLEMHEQAWNRRFEDGEQGKPLRSCPYRAGYHRKMVLDQRLHRG